MDEPLEIDVQVSTIGTLYGSDTEGQPVKENVTADALSRLADRLNETGQEVLVDVDHKSVAPGPDRDTRAAGWLSRFWTTAKGLFGKLRLTPHGQKLVEGREYRSLSPVFTLDEMDEPIEMHSVALTNQPAMQMDPILNTAPSEEIEMSKEEIIELIKATVAEMKAAEEAVEKQESAEDKTEEAKPEEVENTCGEKEPEAKNEQPAEELKEEPKEEPVVKPVEEKEEVIKVEALNSMPVAPSLDKTEAWSKLSGKAFWDYLSKHPECR